MKRWADISADIIAGCIAHGRSAGLSVAEIRKLVDDSYPFGQRAYHPYKQWLKVRRRLFTQAGLRTPAEIERDHKAVAAGLVREEPAPVRDEPGQQTIGME